MGTTLFTSCGFSFNRLRSYNHHHQHQSSLQQLKSHHHHHQNQICFQSLQRSTTTTTTTTITSMAMGEDSNEKSNSFEFDNENGCLDKRRRRRSALISGVSLVLSSAVLGSFPIENGMAVVKQGLLAGRVPGLSEPDEQGWRTYRRPDEKSGGHGVGWSPIIPYTFSVPEKWEEVPVSIADLGGTEIDLRFSSSQEGRLFVIVAPVLRFADNLGDDVKIEMIGTPDKVISAFGPEVIGENVEGKVLSTDVAEHLGRTYYQYELEPPHVLISATAAGNRFYMFGLTANGLQWKRHYKDLKRIADSFRVV